MKPFVHSHIDFTEKICYETQLRGCKNKSLNCNALATPLHVVKLRYAIIQIL